MVSCHAVSACAKAWNYLIQWMNAKNKYKYNTITTLDCYYYGLIMDWDLEFSFINTESNLSELASMMKLLYERINTADGGVTQCTAQYSNVLNCTLQSQSGKESSSTPQFPALDRPSTGVSASVTLCCIPVIISLVWSSGPRYHTNISLSHLPLSTCLNLTQTGQTNNGNLIFAFSWPQQEM